MNWLKAKRLIRRKPYLLDPYRCRSAEEAQKILDEEGEYRRMRFYPQRGCGPE